MRDNADPDIKSLHFFQVKTDLGNLTFIDLNFEGSVNTLEFSNPHGLKCNSDMDYLFDKTLSLCSGPGADIVHIKSL